MHSRLVLFFIFVSISPDACFSYLSLSFCLSLFCFHRLLAFALLPSRLSLNCSVLSLFFCFGCLISSAPHLHFFRFCFVYQTDFSFLSPPYYAPAAAAVGVDNASERSIIIFLIGVAVLLFLFYNITYCYPCIYFF